MLGNEDFWDDLLAHLKARVLLPVVGPEMLPVPSGDRTLPLEQVIAGRLAKRYELDLGADGGYGLDDAVRAFIAARDRGDLERLYRVVNDTLSDIDPPVPEALRQLARIDDLQLFVSTTFDSLLTRALNEVREESPARQLWFSPNQSTLEQQRNATPPGPGETVVFKLFGEASSTPQYAIHEEDLLEWLHSLLSRTARLPEWLEPELKQRPLLFVGCHIPDWVGPFLVRMTSSTRLSLAAKQFFFVGTSVAERPSLAAFFRAHCGATRVQFLHADPAEFVAELHERWRARTPVPAAAGELAAVEPQGTIFISYVREDAEVARRLRDAISGLGGDVWLDERRLQPGDRWEEDILAAIRRQVRLFVPVISANTEAREEGYVFREWAEAVGRAKGIPSRRFIVPAVADSGYDGNPNRYRQIPEDFRQFHFGHAPAGEPSPELLAALTAEIRAMRRVGTA